MACHPCLSVFYVYFPEPTESIVPWQLHYTFIFRRFYSHVQSSFCGRMFVSNKERPPGKRATVHLFVCVHVLDAFAPTLKQIAEAANGPHHLHPTRRCGGKGAGNRIGLD